MPRRREQGSELRCSLFLASCVAEGVEGEWCSILSFDFWKRMRTRVQVAWTRGRQRLTCKAHHVEV